MKTTRTMYFVVLSTLIIPNISNNVRKPETSVIVFKVTVLLIWAPMFWTVSQAMYKKICIL